MRLGLRLVLLVAVLAAGASAVDLLLPGEFSNQFAAMVSAKRPRVTVSTPEPLQVDMKLREGDLLRVDLTAPYETYKRAPDKLEEILDPYVEGVIESLSAADKLDPTKIVPVVKTRAWLDGVLAAAGKNADGAALVYDVLNEELVVVYAEDAPASFSYFAETDLESAGIERAGLRQLAADNLVRMFPDIQRQGGDGVYKVSLGGDYEASLLALGSVWRKQSFDVKGDFVFAVPARGILYVTGSDDATGLARVRGHARTDYRDSPYRMTPKLFIRRGGTLSVLPEE